MGQKHRFRPQPTMSAVTQITTKPAIRHASRKGPTAATTAARLAGGQELRSLAQVIRLPLGLGCW